MLSSLWSVTLLLSVFSAEKPPPCSNVVAFTFNFSKAPIYYECRDGVYRYDANKKLQRVIPISEEDRCLLETGGAFFHFTGEQDKPYQAKLQLVRKKSGVHRDSSIHHSPPGLKLRTGVTILQNGLRVLPESNADSIVFECLPRLGQKITVRYGNVTHKWFFASLIVKRRNVLYYPKGVPSGAFAIVARDVFDRCVAEDLYYWGDQKY